MSVLMSDNVCVLMIDDVSVFMKLCLGMSQ